MIDLSAAGLNETEAKCYTALLELKDATPAGLAKIVKESRTNCYKILDKLVEAGLAERFDKDKKLHYRADNPAQLLELARQRRDSLDKAERALENNAQQLFNSYYLVNEQPGVRYYKGRDELKEIYLDQIKTREPIYIIRPDYNMDAFDFDYMSGIRHMARKAGIKRYAITPDRPKAPKNYKESDPYMILERTWLAAGDYTAPVEWNAYGNKLAIMSFGNEVIGTIIESPQIAEAFKQLYELLADGLRKRPGYDSLPKKARYIRAVG
jgi:sugar-specific transcriptional regulator TrmB